MGALQGQDVDRQACVVYLDRSWKTRTSRRAVPVSRELVELLPQVGSREHVFVGARSKRKLSSATISGVFARILVRAGLGDEKLGSIHCLRRAWIVAAQQAEVRPEISMRLVGHASLKAHADYARRAVSKAAVQTAQRVRDTLPAWGDAAGSPRKVEPKPTTPTTAPRNRAARGAKWAAKASKVETYGS